MDFSRKLSLLDSEKESLEAEYKRRISEMECYHNKNMEQTFDEQ